MKWFSTRDLEAEQRKCWNLVKLQLLETLEVQAPGWCINPLPYIKRPVSADME